MVKLYLCLHSLSLVKVLVASVTRLCHVGMKNRMFACVGVFNTIEIRYFTHFNYLKLDNFPCLVYFICVYVYVRVCMLITEIYVSYPENFVI